MAKKDLTIKQAQVKASSLLRGINNDSVTMERCHERIKGAVKEVHDLVTSVITPSALSMAKSQHKETPKASEAAKKPPKVVQDNAVEPPQKAEKPKKPVKLVKTAKPVKKSESKGAVKTEETVRPTLKQIVKGYLSVGPMEQSEIYRKACSEYGKWSRQSLYSALKDEKTFEKVGESSYQIRDHGVVISKAEADGPSDLDKFIDEVESNSSVSSVQ